MTLGVAEIAAIAQVVASVGMFGVIWIDVGGCAALIHTGAEVRDDACRGTGERHPTTVRYRPSTTSSP